MTMAVHLDRTNYFIVTFPQTNPDEAVLKERLDFVNAAIDKGFHISSEHLFQFGNDVYFQVSLVRYPPKTYTTAEVDRVPYNPVAPYMRKQSNVKRSKV